MPKRRVLAALFLLALGACAPAADTRSPVGPTTGPLPSPPTGAPSPSPSGIEIRPGQYLDPVAVAFCVTEERIIGIEARIIQDELTPKGARRAFLKAARMAAGQVPILVGGDRPKAAAATERWAAALREGAELAAGGEEGYEALKPSIEALSRIHKHLSCELDLDDPVPEADDGE